MAKTDLYLYGASGHAKVIIDLARALGLNVAALIDDNPEVNQLRDIPVLHSAEGLNPIMISIGSNKIRKEIAEKLCGHAFSKALIHPSAIVSPSAKIGEGTVVMAGAIIQADAVIGKHCIVNTGASIDHECVIGDYCHISPHATLCGQVHVGEGSWIGAGATVIPCKTIGSWTTVGAGATVITDTEKNTVCVGTPAKPISTNNILNIKTITGGVKSSLSSDMRHNYNINGACGSSLELFALTA